MNGLKFTKECFATPLFSRSLLTPYFFREPAGSKRASGKQHDGQAEAVSKVGWRSGTTALNGGLSNGFILVSEFLTNRGVSLAAVSSWLT